MKNKKIIGILGGMGSASTAHFFDIVVKHQQKMGCIEDSDFCEVILYNLPPVIEWHNNEFENQENFKNHIINAIKKIESFNCDVIAIPCNTIHYYYDEIQKSTHIPIINMVQETIKKVDDDNNGKERSIGIMCTSTTNRLKLYKNYFIYPNENIQQRIDELIISIQSGNENVECFSDLAMEFVKNNSLDGIVIGCTDLSIPCQKSFIPTTIYDSSKILVESLFK